MKTQFVCLMAPNQRLKPKKTRTMTFFAAIGSSYANLFRLSGRASRSEYWWFILYQNVVGFAVAAAIVLIAFRSVLSDGSPSFVPSSKIIRPDTIGQDTIWLLFIAYLLLFVVPGLTLTVRRLHDTNRSGYWIWFLPFTMTLDGFLDQTSIIGWAGFLLMAFFLCLPGTPGHNKYGPNPLRPKGHLRNAPLTYPPEILAKNAKNEETRRSEIMAYYRKNVAKGK